MGVLSSDEVPSGKPAPDIYLQITQQLDVPARQPVVVEDSSNGI
jgi:HAD superfamily hydrolase (TIGR01509 family)